MNCRHCGDLLTQERADEGYDYCVKPECVDMYMRALNVVAIHVNKSNDQFALRDQLDIPEIAGRTSIDGGQYGVPHRTKVPEPEVLTDGQRIRRMRIALEAKLESCDDKDERSRLIDAYNSEVRRMNIRYRRTALYREEEPAGP